MDYITFASASAVKAFAAMAENPGDMTAKAVCIGPVKRCIRDRFCGTPGCSL